MDIARKTLAENIRKKRKALGWTQEKLALNAGITAGSVNRIEQGKHPPRASNLEAIAKALGTSVDELQSPPPKPVTAPVLEISEIAAFLARLAEISADQRNLIFALVFEDASYLEGEPRLARVFATLVKGLHKVP